jgi:tetratricopeptide (TPR) repeat protein
MLISEAQSYVHGSTQMRSKLAEALGHHRAGRLSEAEQIYRQILALDGRHADSLHLLGMIEFQRGNHETAARLIGQAIALKGDQAAYHSNLAIVLRAQDKLDEAAACCRRALALAPGLVETQTNLGNILLAQGNAREAAACQERALILKPDLAEGFLNLGNARQGEGRFEEAAVCYQQALAIQPDYAEGHHNLGNVLTALGRFGQAMAHYDRAIAIQPGYAMAHYARAQIKVFQRGDGELTALESLALDGNLPAGDAVYVHFALAKALEETGEYNHALAHFEQGNRLKRGQIHYDEGAALALFERIRSVFDRGLFHRLRETGDPSPVPVFVLGMPRSGTTLIEQILASHPQIQAAGELGHIENMAGAWNTGDPPVPYPECLSSVDGNELRELGRAYLARLPALDPGQVLIVDKSLANFLHIGLIRLILPNARIIHSVRHPIDTCVSCYSKLFTAGLAFTYDLGELGRYYRAYTEIMAHWRAVVPGVLDVSYEDVIGDLEGQARRLIGHCGLPWDGRCIEFYKTERPVKTASSVQVRRPLFRSSLERWRRYESGLTPLLAELRGADSGPTPSG